MRRRRRTRKTLHVVMKTCMVYRGHKTRRRVYVPVRYASHSVVGLEASVHVYRMNYWFRSEFSTRDLINLIKDFQITDLLMTNNLHRVLLIHLLIITGIMYLTAKSQYVCYQYRNSDDTHT